MPSWQAGRERARPAWDHSPCPHFRALGTCPAHLLSRGCLALSLHSAASPPAPRRPSSVTAAVGAQGRGQHRPAAAKPSATPAAPHSNPAPPSGAKPPPRQRSLPAGDRNFARSFTAPALAQTAERGLTPGSAAQRGSPHHPSEPGAGSSTPGSAKASLHTGDAEPGPSTTGSSGRGGRRHFARGAAEGVETASGSDWRRGASPGTAGNSNGVSSGSSPLQRASNKRASRSFKPANGNEPLQKAAGAHLTPTWTQRCDLGRFCAP